MRMAEQRRLAMAFAALNGAAMVGKLLARWPLNIISLGEDPKIMPAPMSDPKVLIIIFAMIAFGALTAWVGRPAKD